MAGAGPPDGEEDGPDRPAAGQTPGPEGAPGGPAVGGPDAGGAPEPEDPGFGGEPGPVRVAAALVTAAGLLALFAGVVVTVTAGGCILDRTDPFGRTCTGVVREPWFALVALVTVVAAAVGAVLGLADLAAERW